MVEMTGVERAELVAANVELIAALEAQHHAIDWLPAQLMLRDRGFRPTQSPIWSALALGHAALAKARGETGEPR
jgi:hypothetical protein